MNIQAVLFDLGGVILRTEHQAPREHLAERLNMTYEDLDKIVFASETSRLASIGKLSTAQHLEAITKRLGLPSSAAEQVYAEFFAGDVLDQELLDFIRSLRPQRKTALISNGWPDLRDYITRNRFLDAFDTLLISAEVGLLKPDPKIYELALGRLQVQASQSALVDDTLANVEGAKTLGMHGILFESTAQVRRDLETMLD
jgi:epoxide hydrolase-like predicted phosphatase